jgi:hypothetical protein
MEIQFPKDFTFYFKAPETKACFVSEIAPITPVDCENCGGVGKIFIFVATGGPFREAPGAGKVGHWHKDRWWVGGTHSGTCPVCKGLGRKESDPQFHVDTKHMEDTFEKARQIWKD